VARSGGSKNKSYGTLGYKTNTFQLRAYRPEIRIRSRWETCLVSHESQINRVGNIEIRIQNVHAGTKLVQLVRGFPTQNVQLWGRDGSISSTLCVRTLQSSRTKYNNRATVVYKAITSELEDF